MPTPNGTVEDAGVSINALNGTLHPVPPASNDINMENGGTSPPPATTPIAIIGLGCRFPGDATSPDNFWKLVSESRGAWSEIPKDRFNPAAFHHAEPSKIGSVSGEPRMKPIGGQFLYIYTDLVACVQQSNIWGGHFLKEDVSLFDASFFNLSAEVAASMDPQTRLQLETVFEAAEDAGITLSQLAGSQTSVFAALWVREYHDAMMRRPESLPRYYLTGNGAAMASNRVSHFFDLRGASATIDTACSSSLTALHLACQSLRSGDSTMSIVGGVNLILNPDMFIALSTLGMAGAQGRSYSFDQRAEGFGRGEGVAALLLKPLDDALRDGDPIRAVIRETALNQDGRTPTITSPSQEAQEELIRSCYRRAGLNPLDTAYVETHGTGTMVGDSIEAGALGKVFAAGRSADEPLLIGSVKSNIGHLEAASGLAAVVKVALALEHGFIPPNYDFVQESQKIPFRELGIRVVSELQRWPAHLPRRASVNSFGYGGTNSHVIMEAAEYHLPGAKEHRRRPSVNGSTLHASGLNGSAVNGTELNGTSINGSVSDKHSPITPRPNGSHSSHNGVIGSSHTPAPGRFIFPISARDEAGVKTMMSRLKDFLHDKGQDVDLESLAYTLTERRERFSWTAAPHAADVEELMESLGGTGLKPALSRAEPRLGFVFNGQGAQWFAMGRELMGAYPVFDQCLDEAEGHLRSFGCEWSLREELCRDKQTSRVNETQLSMPLCVAIQIALFTLLESWNIRPTVVTGHSSGEVAAAYAAGAFDLRSALAASYYRGMLTTSGIVEDKTMSGSMMAVGLGAEAVQPYLDNITSGKVVVACVNSPSSVTLSGDTAGVDELETLFKANEIFARKLLVPAAFHSFHMNRIADKYQAALEASIQMNPTLNGVGFTSPVTGTWVTESKTLGPAHWVKNMVQPVLFSQCFHRMCIDEPTTGETPTRNIDVVVELGPHGALGGPIRQCLAASESLKDQGIGYGSCLNRGTHAVQTMQALAAMLLDRGYGVDLSAVNFPRGARNLSVLRLPSYPWNHSTSLWLEPRQNRDYRLRKHPVHDLLGVSVPECNPSAPSWRHQILLSEMPWVRDHVVDNEIVYPAAGMIAMAIEGLRQLSEEDELIEGYFIHDVEITNAAIVPDTPQGLELRLFLGEVDNKALRPDCRDFTIFAVPQQGDWIECCKGLIRIHTVANVDGPASRPPLPQPAQDADVQPEDKDVPSEDFFGQLQDVGLRYGRAFQNLDRIRCGQGRSSVTLHVGDSASTMPRGFQSEHVIHPITLDSVLQSAFTVITPEQHTAMGGSVPRSIQSMYVSSKISAAPGHTFCTKNNLLDADSKGFEAAMVLSNVDPTDDAVPVLEVTNIRYQALGSGTTASNSQATGNLALRTKWVHDMSRIGTDAYKESIRGEISPEELLLLEDLKRASVYFIHDTLQQLTQEDVDQLEWHHKVLYEWLLHQQELAAKDEIAPRSSAWAKAKPGIKQRLWDQVAAASVNGEMTVRIGKNLLGIMRRQITPLELMMEGKLLYKYYEKLLRMSRSFEQLEQILQVFSHACPRPKILEIGGGTGSATGPALRAMSSGDDGVQEPRLSRYDFTDVSSGFLEAAHEKFAPWAHLMTFNTLDIENDPQEQGFELQTYDLIIACQVLHATKDMTHTLANVHKLLKPGGKLVMVETTQDAIDVQLVFGTVPGWWLSTEPERKYSPNMPLSMWADILGRSGFSGLDLAVNDCEDERNYAMSVIVSTALPATPADHPSSVALVHGPTMPPQEWLASLQSSIHSRTGVEPSVKSLTEFVPDETVAIFVAEIESPVLDGVDGPTFDAIKRMLNGAKGCLWLSRGASVESPLPERALHTGLLRTLRLEDTAKRYAAMDLDNEDPAWSNASIGHIADYFARAFNYATDKTAIDFEVAVRGDSLLLPRVTPDNVETVDAQPKGKSTQLDPEPQPFGVSSDRPLSLQIRTQGDLDSVAFVELGGVPEDQLDDGFIEVEAKAFGINSRDAVFSDKKPDSTRIGFECSGIVTRIAPAANILHDFKVGDRVCGFSTGDGHLGHLVRVRYTTMAKIPDDMSFEAGASIPIAFVTAYLSVIDKARLEKHEKILIHSAAGGVGQAAIMLAQSLGAEVFATAGSQGKRQLLRDVYGIQDDHIFSSRDVSFAAGVMATTKGAGVDVVLNALTGEMLHESCGILSPLGRLVDIGQQDTLGNKRLEMKAFDNGKSFLAVDVAKVVELQGRVVRRALKECMDLLETKRVRPVQPLTVYPISEVTRAFQSVQDGKHTGKILVSTGAEHVVPVVPGKEAVKLRADASYLLAGGFGGIGRSLIRWFVAHGARNILVLSRSVASRSDSADFVKEIEGQGCRVVLKNCDIAVADDLSRAFNESSSELPPVKGVIQAAMVLNDSVFEHMDHQQWSDATRPKVLGTRNVHDFFGSDLDFFVMLSSLTGVVGNASQGNYAAGGSFQDAFASWRTSQGLPAVSIDLGTVKSVGYVAETEGVAARMERAGYVPQEEEEVLGLIEAAIRTPSRQSSTRPSQVITGIGLYDDVDVAWRKERRFANLLRASPTGARAETSGSASNGDEREGLADLVVKASTLAEARDIVADGIADKLADMFMLPAEEIDKSRGLAKYGVDSLVAVELRTWLSGQIQTEISIFDMLQSASLMAVAEKAATRSKLVIKAGLGPGSEESGSREASTSLPAS
ncbi:Lovastatin nonaketide synthase-like protein [Hapsidospora chrysogenum ATCC 11550]|uniref:Lovastatin nonaketide synthase-like protein n=1 Tax=Hapsidospora chrysogenum (strain ATCC 11550 / CBS 779.69 / DSM 880 / IAM 14645 / JCM 23072 / IMI 49137) TaxID=857340 RepID=A0A086SUY1_HAPC1|nr:Lovastatin nonaketide synthase-like protein [Hapsidospora chrysogenum ATCC 11550]